MKYCRQTEASQREETDELHGQQSTVGAWILGTNQVATTCRSFKGVGTTMFSCYLAAHNIGIGHLPSSEVNNAETRVSLERWFPTARMLFRAEVIQHFSGAPSPA